MESSAVQHSPGSWRPLTMHTTCSRRPGPISVISVPGDKRDALVCADQIYREAVTAADRDPLAAEAPGGMKKTQSGKPLMPTPASAPLRSVALPSRTHHRA